MKELLEKQQKTIKAFGIFIVIMLGCTFLSRAIYVTTLPQVQIIYPEKGKIAHITEVEGTVRQSKEYAQASPAGMLVKTVDVRAGDHIEQGALLYEVDTIDLQSLIDRQKTDIKKLELQTESILANRQLSQLKGQTKLQRAKEDYVINGNLAKENTEKLKKELEKAKQEVADHEANEVHITTQNNRDKKQKEYDSWVERGKQLSAAVKQAQEKAEEAKKSLAEGSGTQEAVEKAEKAVKDAEKALEKYEEAPETAPDYSGEDNKKEVWKTKKEELVKIADTAQEAMEAAQIEEEKILREAKRSIEDSHADVTADSSAEINQLEMECARKTLEEYEKLLQAEGKVVGNAEGIITKINVLSGNRTSDEAAVIYADSNSPLLFECAVTKEQKQYVNLNDSVSLVFGESNSVKAAVDYLQESESSPGSYQIACKLSGQDAVIGEGGRLKTQFLSKQYPLTVPISVLYEENKQYYLYVVEETDTVLGKELCARRVSVKVLEQNESMAALEEGVVDADSKIIAESNKEYKNGGIIRFAD